MADGGSKFSYTPAAFSLGLARSKSTPAAPKPFVDEGLLALGRQLTAHLQDAKPTEEAGSLIRLRIGGELEQEDQQRNEDLVTAVG